MQPQATTPKSNKGKVIIGSMLAVVAAAGVISFLTAKPKKMKKAGPKTDLVFVNLPPPPPPPPPPPKVEPPPPKDEPKPKEEMVEQEPVPDDEPPPEEAKTDEPPQEALGTNIQGNGPDMGLRSGGGNGIGGNSKGGRKGGGSKWGYYAAKIQSTISSALRSNSNTRSASFSMQVKVWLDDSGRITRASLVGSSGNSAVDQAIKSQVLSGLQLPEAPPADMPMPITIRISARKPS